MSEKLKTQQEPELTYPTFKLGDKVRFNDTFPQNLKTAHAFEIDFGAIHTVTYVSERGFVGTDLLGEGWQWQVERFSLVERAPEPTSSPWAWSGGITGAAVDPDLKREGYHEECSEYRACQNERGDWIVEATRKKIIAQAADEAEAVFIAKALNNNINN